ncbi:hypothetical protein NL676_000908 [Syzygium grande]|nr:hypothetical protein NL676_000908 [Syzygium grande]
MVVRRREQRWTCHGGGWHGRWATTPRGGARAVVHKRWRDVESNGCGVSLRAPKDPPLLNEASLDVWPPTSLNL